MSLRKRLVGSLTVTQEGHVKSLDNPDLRPTPVKDRRWGIVTYSVFWMGAISATGSWIATPLTSGLGVWSAVFAMLPGMVLSGLLLAINGRAGAIYHIPYPVFCRSAFGIYGAYWPVLCRVLVTLAFSATNMASAAQLVTIAITCLSKNYTKIPNTMGSDSILTSADMVSFLIFWLILGAFCLVPVTKWKYMIFVKIVVYWASTFALLGWVLHETGGAGPILSYPSSVTGSQYSWTMVQFVFYFLNQSSSYISNAGDFSRTAVKPRDPLIGHIFCFPVANLVNTIVGFIILGASQPLFGEAQWNPGLFLKAFIERDYTPGARAGMFFICIGLLWSALVSAALENNLPGAFDLMGMCPRFINLRRAFFLVLIFGWIFNPWYLLGSASIFISFIVGLSNLLSSIIGILIAQYYILARGHLDIPMLYSNAKDGPYHYWHGFNWRAFAAYVLGVIPNFYGFLGDMGVKITTPAKHMEYFSCIIGISVSAFFFVALTHFFPPTHALPRPSKWSEPKDYIEPSDPAFGVIDGLDSADVEEQSVEMTKV